jgi:hypothetical protein
MGLIKRVVRKVVGYLAYRICEWLEPRTSRRTGGVIDAASEAIVAYVAIDWRRALDQQDDLPGSIAAVMGQFSPDEWREVMAGAAFSGGLVQLELRRDEYRHLRQRTDCECPTA